MALLNFKIMWQPTSMNAVLSPIVSEYETQEAADSKDAWFRAKVQESRDDPRPIIPHDVVMAKMRALLKSKLIDAADWLAAISRCRIGWNTKLHQCSQWISCVASFQTHWISFRAHFRAPIPLQIKRTRWRCSRDCCSPKLHTGLPSWAIQHQSDACFPFAAEIPSVDLNSAYGIRINCLSSYYLYSK